jgi:hypothetical protein
MSLSSLSCRPFYRLIYLKDERYLAAVPIPNSAKVITMTRVAIVQMSLVMASAGMAHGHNLQNIFYENYYYYSVKSLLKS